MLAKHRGQRITENVAYRYNRPGCYNIACVIVWLMKGPAYVADAYPLPDSDRPAP